MSAMTCCPRSPLARPVSLALALAAAAAFGGAPADQPVVREQAAVSLVEVPVTVLDHDGKPVKGLTAADFDVRDDGKEVPIQAVDVTEFVSGVPAPGVHQTVRVSAAARRRFLLLFDLSFSTPSRVSRVRDAARKFVGSQMGPDDLAAVATYSIEHGLNLVVTFTSDRSQLAAAVQTLGFVNNSEKSPDPLNLTELLNIPFEFVAAGGPGTANAGKGKSDDLIAEGNRQTAAAARRGDAEYRKGRVRQLFEGLGMVARALDSVEGRKHVIYFSQGFDMRLLQGNAQDSAEAQEANENAAHGQIWNIDSQARFGNSGLQSAMNDMLDLFKRSDCVVHAVDLTGLAAAGDTSDPSGGSGQAALYSIAEGTGGELFKNANDFSAELDKLLEEQSLVYVLTFSPRLTGKPDRYHAIKVRVKRSGASVSSRAGYFEPRPFQATSGVEKKLTAADVIASEIPVHGLATSLLAQAFAGKDSAFVSVEISVPSADLRAPSKTGKIPLEIYGYAFDGEGRIADFSTQTAVLDLASVRERIEAGGLRYFAQFKLAPGPYRLRALVRNGDTGAMGFAAEDIVVPDFAQKKPYLVPPLAVSTANGLVLRGKSAHSGEALEFPYMIGEDPFLPDAHPAVARNGELRLAIYTYSLGDPSKLRMGGKLLDSSGKPLGDANLSLLGRSSLDETGRSTYLVAFKPGDVTPGSYMLRVIVNDPGSGAARQATTRIEVR
jgi:VWFA-related protein